MPNLTHVWFEMLWRPLIDQNRVHSILEWLRFYGKRLETFYWLDFDSGITDSDVDKVWSLCPNLQRLQLPVDARWTPPPSSHQIRLLRVEEHDEPPPSVCSLCRSPHYFSIQFSNSLGQLANSGVQRIQASPLVWHERMAHDNDHSIYCFMMEARSHGIVVVDMCGWSFEQAILAHLKARKKLYVHK